MGNAAANADTSDSPRAKIFRDDNLERTIREDGFALIDLFTPEEHAALTELVHGINDDKSVNHADVHVATDFRLSAFNNNSAYKRRLYDEIFRFAKGRYDALLADYEPLVINVFDKLPGAGSVAIHQNPSFVYEPQYKSVSIWVPTIDANRDNGTIGVLRGSHDVFDAVRAANMPDIFAPCAKKLTEVYFEALSVKRGQAVVLDDSIIHWSYPNRSRERRTTIQFISVPKNAEHVYSYYNTTGSQPMIEEYDVTKEFFFGFNCKESPQNLKFRRSYPYRYHDLTETELLRRVHPRNKNLPATPR